MSESGSAPLDRYELSKVALGESEADLAIINGSIVNVYTAELLTGDTILIKGDKIACVGKYAKRGIGPSTRVIDAAGKILVPGFIDGHTHMDYLCSTREVVRFAAKTGTTSIITEIVEVAFRLGYRGIIDYLKSTRGHPIKFWFTLPPMGTISPVSRQHLLSLAEVRRLLRRKDCVGLGEIYWGMVTAGDPQQLAVVAETLRAGKKVEGHSAGAAANKLQAYSALGVSSDHEPISADEALERMRLGLSVLAREGEVREDLEAVSLIKDRKIDFRRLAVSTDGIGPRHLVTYGFMEHVVQRAIDLGFPAVQAIQMGTLNVAEHFNLQDFIGGIAPGRFADVVMLPSLNVIRPEMVVSSGQIVLEQGKNEFQPRPYNYPGFTKGIVNIKRELRASDFTVPVADTESRVKVRVIDQLTKVLTREMLTELPVISGRVQPDIAQDIIKVAAIEYIHTAGKAFTGFIHGLGLKMGAVATSTCWDSTDIMVAGANETDMALAVNRIKVLGGGTVVCLNGDFLAELAFPIGSLISEESMEAMADRLKLVQDSAAMLGCTSEDIRTTLSVLTTPAIPYLRICESGLFNVRLNGPIDLFVK
jgi:adenine deaminase